MRCLLQRVTRAGVSVEGVEIGRIGPGLLVLVCAMQGDKSEHARKAATKVAAMRIFKDDAGRMNRSLLDVGGAALVVSQFTLAADTSRGNRPGFSNAAAPDEGQALYEAFSDALGDLGIKVARGQFGADMAVDLVNDGPVTIWLDICGAGAFNLAKLVEDQHGAFGGQDGSGDRVASRDRVWRRIGIRGRGRARGLARIAHCR